MDNGSIWGVATLWFEFGIWNLLFYLERGNWKLELGLGLGLGNWGNFNYIARSLSFAIKLCLLLSGVLIKHINRYTFYEVDVFPFDYYKMNEEDCPSD